MSITLEQLSANHLASAAELADRLGLKRIAIKDVTEGWNNHPMLIATPKGTNIGALRLRLGETRTGQFIEYFLNEKLVATEKNATTDEGWADDSTIEVFLDEGSIIYVGEVALPVPKVRRCI